MYNIEDPENIRAVTKSSKSARKWWKKAHGFYFAARLPGVERTGTFFQNMTVCTEKCIELENSKFAKNCRKRDGYFKCCVSDSSIGEHGDIGPKLAKLGLVKDAVKSPCSKYAKEDPCHWCTVDGFCTIKDPMTGLLGHMFYPNEEIRTHHDKKKSM